MIITENFTKQYNGVNKRFFLILFIICLVPGVAAATGVTNYDDALDKYKNGNEGYVFFPSLLLVFNQITSSIGLDGQGVRQILLAVNFVPVLQFKSVNKDNILCNSKRKEIWRVVKEHPGMSYTELKGASSHTEGDFRYHLEMLVRYRYLEKYQINGFIGYFNAGGSVTDSEKGMIIALKSKTGKEIYSILLKNKEISRKELSEHLDITGPTVTWHMKRLISLGIVRATYSGNSVCYCLSDVRKPLPEM
ncbi:hypothetical protein JCM10550A_13730 [Methanogenium cariaci]